MTRVVKEFTIESWVTGDPKDQLFKISVSPVDSFESDDSITLPEALSKLQKFETQYMEILEQNKSLEEQLYNSQCQIRALQVSNLYTQDSHLNVNFSNDSPDNLPHNGQDKPTESLEKQIYLQKRIIDDLMCKLQNMHNRFEYFKEDITELKSQYEKERVSAEVEKQHKTVAFEQYQESLHTISQLKSEIEKLKQIAKKRHTLKVIERVVVEKSNYQIDNENNLLEQKFQVQAEEIRNKFSAQLLITQQRNALTVESLAINMKKRIEEIKGFYEFRILSMIQEFSFEEGKFSSKILMLSQQIRENIAQISDLEKQLLVFQEKFKFGQENQKQARNVISNLQAILDSLSLEKAAESTRAKFEIQSSMQKLEEVQDDLKHDFGYQTKLAQQKYKETVKMLKKSYEHKIEKIQEEFKESERKMLAKERTETLILMNEITRLEKDKTRIEMMTESRVQDVVREAKSVRCI